MPPIIRSRNQPPQYDHITPLGLGGKDTTENMEVLCLDCHAVKTKEDRAKMTDLKRQTPKPPAIEIKPSRYQDRLGFKVTPHKGLNLPRVWLNGVCCFVSSQYLHLLIFPRLGCPPRPPGLTTSRASGCTPSGLRPSSS